MDENPDQGTKFMFGYSYPYIPDATRDLKDYIKPKVDTAGGKLGYLYDKLLEYICCCLGQKRKDNRAKYEIKQEVKDVIQPKYEKK